ncbi:MAG: hypothetical protein EXS38_05420 [Opitutus sp.]|nr:hypothetical protein [Opitutus sp.]
MLAVAFAVEVSGAAPAKPPPAVLVVADVFGDVPEALRPQPGKPIRYAIAGNYESNIGTPIAGEPRANAAAVETEVTKVLATQGFIKTKVGEPLPAIALLITWGSAVLDTSEMPVMPLPGRVGGNPPDPNNPLDPNVASDTILVSFNGRQISQLIGADKASNGAVDPGTLAEINSAAGDTRVYIFIVAFDLEAMAKKKEKKMLWRTRISIPSIHHSLPDSLGVMLTSAAPFLGHEVAVPVFVGVADRRKAEVQMGAPYVVPDKSATDGGAASRRD